MIGQIQQAKKSKSLKTLSVQIEGVWYTSKNWELEQAVNRRIIFEPSRQDFQDGGHCLWLNDYVFEDQQTTPAGKAMDQAQAAAQGLMPAPARQPNKDSLIGAMALCKCCIPGTPDQVFENFQLLYHKLESWDVTIPF